MTIPTTAVAAAVAVAALPAFALRRNVLQTLTNQSSVLFAININLSARH
jgi:hypothetical protein